MENNGTNRSNEINKKESIFSENIMVWLLANLGLNASFCCSVFSNVEKKYALLFCE